MVRNYQQTSTRASQYANKYLSIAVEEVRSNRMTLGQACSTYNIPKTTLLYHAKGKRGVKSDSFGRPISLPLPVERELVDGLIAMEKWDFGLSRTEIINLVGDFCNNK